MGGAAIESEALLTIASLQPAEGLNDRSAYEAPAKLHFEHNLLHRLIQY